MKNVIIATLLGAASLSVVSCSSVMTTAGATLECMFAANKVECMAGKAFDTAADYLADAVNLKSKEDADDFASKWKVIQTSLKTAQTLGAPVPEKLKEVYNSTLARIKKHNYFHSDKLESVMGDAEPLQ